MKTVKVIFENSAYNYTTSINGTDDEIKKYFIGNCFNLGTVEDSMQKCINVEIVEKMSNEVKHTPTPWKQDGISIDAWLVKYMPNAESKLSHEELIANASFMVKAVNCHYELLAACEYVVKWHREHDSGEGELYGLDFVTTCIAAISKTKGILKNDTSTIF